MPWAQPVLPGLLAGRLAFNKMSEHVTAQQLTATRSSASPRVQGYSVSCMEMTHSYHPPPPTPRKRSLEVPATWASVAGTGGRQQARSEAGQGRGWCSSEPLLLSPTAVFPKGFLPHSSPWEAFTEVRGENDHFYFSAEDSEVQGERGLVPSHSPVSCRAGTGVFVLFPLLL